MQALLICKVSLVDILIWEDFCRSEGGDLDFFDWWKIMREADVLPLRIGAAGGFPLDKHFSYEPGVRSSKPDCKAVGELGRWG